MSYENSLQNSEIEELYLFTLDAVGNTVALTSCDYAINFENKTYEPEAIQRNGQVGIAVFDATEELSLTVPLDSEIAHILFSFNPTNFQRTCEYIRKQKHKSDPREVDYLHRILYAVEFVEFSGDGTATISLAHLAQKKLSNKQLPVLRMSQQCNFELGDKNCKKVRPIYPMPTDGQWWADAHYRFTVSDANPLVELGSGYINLNGYVYGTLSNGRGVITLPYTLLQVYRTEQWPNPPGPWTIRVFMTGEELRSLMESGEISSLNIVFGCAKTITDCKKLDNSHNFGGFITSLSEYTNPYS